MKIKLGKIKNIIFLLLCTILLSLAIISMSFFCYGASISGDEYFSMGFANNTKDFLFLSQGTIERYGTDGWIEGKFLHDWLSVQPGEQFSIMQIHRNVRDDVHPPLYFMLLNCISSLFVDQVTLFPGYFINVVSGILICVFLFLISKKIFTNPWMSLIPPVFWISSNAAGITMTYLRMYAPLCALCLIAIYIHICYLQGVKTPKYIYIYIGVCAFIGILTHYYFILILFILFCETVAILTRRKEYRKIVFYGLSLFIAALGSFIVYPYIFRHIFFSERGAQAQENLKNISFSYYIGFLKHFLETLNEYVYNSKFLYIATFLAILGIIGVIFNLYRKIKNVFISDDKVFCSEYGLKNLYFITVVALGYFFILLKISYSSKWLYISPVFSILLLITTAVFAVVLHKISPKYYVVCLLLISLSIMIPYNWVRIQGSFEEHNNTVSRHEKVVSYAQNCDVIFFYNEWNNLYDNQILELMDFNQIRAISLNDFSEGQINKILLTRKNKDNNLVIYFPITVNENSKIAEKIAKTMGGNSPTIIMEDGHTIYFIAEL